MNVLYVEDNPQDAQLAKRALSRGAPQINLQISSSLAAARAQLAAKPAYDLILCDLDLPDGNGLELLSEIREQGLPLAVVILTGRGDEEIAVAALKAGADDYLAKRDDYLSHLPQVIEDALIRSQAEFSRKAGKLRVLYIENNPADIDFTRRHLAKHAPHIHLDIVDCPQTALNKLPDNPQDPSPYDVLLIDFAFPDMNGLSILKTLREERRLDLPIVFVTGQGDEGIAAHVIRLGASNYLSKHPNYLYELPAALENAFFRAQLLREQAALRESEARYRIIVENSTFAIAVHVDNRIVYINKSACDIVGANNPEELYGRNIIEFVHPDERAMILELIQKGLTQGQEILTEGPQIVEERIIKLDGSILYVEASAIPINYYGKPGLLVMMNNITERKRAEASIQASEAKFRSYIEHAPLAFFMANQKGYYEEFNFAAQELLHYDLDSLKEMTVLDVTSDEDREAVLRDFTSAIEQGYVEGEYRLKRQGGELVWTDVRAVKLKDDRVIAFCQDISERKASEELLRKSEERYKSLFHHMLGGYAYCQMIYEHGLPQDFVYLEVNDAFTTLTGLNHVVGQKVTDVIPGIRTTNPEIFEIYGRVAQTGQPEKFETYLGQLDSWLSVSVYSTEAETFVALFENISERKSAEETLRESELRFRTLIDRAPGAISLSRDGLCLYSNQKFLQTFGYQNEEETQGIPVYEFFAPEFQEASKERARLRALSLPVDTEYESVGLRKDGSQFPIQIVVDQVKLSDGMASMAFITDITQRKQAETALKASEENYRSLTENSESAIAVLDRDGRILYANPNGLRIWNDPDIVGKTIFNIYPQEYAERYSAAIKRVINSRREIVDDVETLINERRMWFRISMSPLRNPDGSVNTLVLNAWDITERKQAEEELKFRNVLLSTQQEASIEAILVVDENAKILSYNRKFIEMFNIPDKLIEDRADQPLLQFVTRQMANPTTFYQRVVYLYEHLEETSEDELTLVDGRIIDRYSAPMFGDDQHYFGRVWYFRDITERKLAEAELWKHRDHLEDLVRERTAKLAESEASLRKYAEEISDLYHNAPCGYQSIDENGMLLSMNDTQLNWLGYTRDEVVSKMNLADLLAPNSRARFEKNFSVFKKTGRLNDVEQEMIRKDGSLLPVLINATAQFDDAGNFIMSRETLLDNTERIQAENALRASKEAAESANRAKSSFLANMSHEIRTPMNAILGFTQLLLREPGLGPAQKQHLTTINKSGEHLLGLINDILEMSKIEADRVILNPTTFDLYTTIHELESMFKLRMDEKMLRFKIEISPDLPQYVHADEKKLRQIWINLLSNAVKFTHSGCVCWRIRSSMKENGQILLYSEVEDSGPGIASDEIGLLFQAFGQTTMGRKIGGGTGSGAGDQFKICQDYGRRADGFQYPGKRQHIQDRARNWRGEK